MTHIIRTIEELEALDPDTVLMQHDKGFYAQYIDPQRAWLDACKIDTDHIFPLAVIATGEQVRQAQQALKEQK